MGRRLPAERLLFGAAIGNSNVADGSGPADGSRRWRGRKGTDCGHWPPRDAAFVSRCRA